jgi:VIT1/CCC1 family predicted Fe2+/Mn2+ transporter
MNQSRRTTADYARNFLFGVEDSLVSSVGLLSGVAVTNMSQATIVTTGVILIAVEAFSMGVGSFLSEETAEEYERRRNSIGRSFKGGLIMFISYLVAGLVPLAPYLIAEPSRALPLSIGASILALIAVGLISAKMLALSYARQAIRLALLGSLAIGVGVGIGSLIN